MRHHRRALKINGTPFRKSIATKAQRHKGPKKTGKRLTEKKAVVKGKIYENY